MDDFSDASLLLIDDDPGTIQVLRRILADYRNLRFAVDGLSGIELASQQTPDLILLDYEMPGISGLETLRRLKNDPAMAEVPVIFVTSRQEGEIESESLNSGAADFINKPLNPLVVLARVKTQLRLKRLNDALRQTARRDGLTGLANRRAFDETLEAEWRRSERNGQALSLMLMDVDHFKRYNDCYGHIAGDEALCSVAAVLADAAKRTSDLAARYGGEEFALILPSTSAESAMGLADGLRTHLTKLAIPHRDSPTAAYLTLSIGVATAGPKDASRSDLHCSVLTTIADRALYAAKQQGRNRAQSLLLPSDSAPQAAPDRDQRPGR